MNSLRDILHFITKYINSNKTRKIANKSNCGY